MCHYPYSLLHISIWNYMKSFRCTPPPVALKNPGFNPDWIYCRTCNTGYPCLLVYPTLYQPRLMRGQAIFDYFSNGTQRSGILNLVKGKTIDHRLGWWWRRLWKKWTQALGQITNGAQKRKSTVESCISRTRWSNWIAKDQQPVFLPIGRSTKYHQIR